VSTRTTSKPRASTTAGAQPRALQAKDVIPLSDPTFGQRWRRVFANKMLQTVAAADSFVFVSAYTRQRCGEFFAAALAGKPASILHPSVDDRIADDAASHVSDAPAAEYMVAIVSDEPRKNIEGLVAAFWHMPAGIGLKLVGHVNVARFQAPKSGWTPHTVAMPPQVEVLGHVSDTEKRRLLAGALGVIVPSFAEGFGIPLIEGLAFGKPVFCSESPCSVRSLATTRSTSIPTRRPRLPARFGATSTTDRPSPRAAPLRAIAACGASGWRPWSARSAVASAR